MSPNTSLESDGAAFLAIVDTVKEWHPAAAPPSDAPPARVMGYTLLTVPDVLNMPAPTWLIDGLIPTQSVSCLVGMWGIGKSFITLDWALSVAVGAPWMEHWTQAGPVVYIAAEGAGGYGKRMIAWQQNTGRALPGPDRFRLIPAPVNLIDEATPGAFLAALAAEGISNPALIVFDTLSRCTLGGEENSNSEIALALDRATQIAQASGAAVLLVHHPGKNGDIRGASALPAGVETIIRVSEQGDSLKIECEKQKDGVKFDPFAVMLTPCADSLIVAPASMAALAGTRGTIRPNQMRILELFNNPALEGGLSRKDVQEATGINMQTVTRELGALITRGLLRKEGLDKSPYARYHLTDAGATLLQGVSGSITPVSDSVTHSVARECQTVSPPLRGDTAIHSLPDTPSAEQGKPPAQPKAPAPPQTRVAAVPCAHCGDQADLTTRPGKTGYWRPCHGDDGKCRRAARAGGTEGGAS